MSSYSLVVVYLVVVGLMKTLIVPAVLYLKRNCFLRAVNLFIVCIIIVLFITVILLHCGSFCHKNKFLVCVNISRNYFQVSLSRVVRTKTKY